MVYNEKNKELTIEILENKLIEKDKEIEELRKENTAIASASHGIIQKLSALEKRVVKLIIQSSNPDNDEGEEEKEEEITKQVEAMMKEYKDAINKK